MVNAFSRFETFLRFTIKENGIRHCGYTMHDQTDPFKAETHMVHDYTEKFLFHLIIGFTHKQLNGPKSIIFMTSMGNILKCLIGYKDIISNKATKNKCTLV